MKPFKFLNTNTFSFGSISLPREIIDGLFVLCQRYNDYVNFCRRDYLNTHPSVDPESDYSFPIPHYKVETNFQMGLLWHGGSDYYHEDDRVTHFVYLDVVGNGEEDDYFFEINEDGFGGFYIYEIGRDRSRWD